MVPDMESTLNTEASAPPQELVGLEVEDEEQPGSRPSLQADEVFGTFIACCILTGSAAFISLLLLWGCGVDTQTCPDRSNTTLCLVQKSDWERAAISCCVEIPSSAYNCHCSTTVSPIHTLCDRFYDYLLSLGICVLLALAFGWAAGWREATLQRRVNAERVPLVGEA